MTASTPARVGRGERGGVLIFVDVECAHAVAAFACDFGDERAGLSFAENEEQALLQPLALSYSQWLLAYRRRVRGYAEKEAELECMRDAETGLQWLPRMTTLRRSS